MGKKFEDTGKGKNKYLIFGFCSKQGNRQTHEDQHDAVLNLEGDENVSYFAVYDGHGGDESAIFIQKNLLKTLYNDKKKDISEKAIQEGFMKTDEIMSKEESIFESFSGTTAVCCFIEANEKEFTLTCGNLGDSRCVFYKKDEVLPMSIDQKPNKPKEKKELRTVVLVLCLGV